MNRFVGILSATIFFVTLLSAQPMSGNYTVGGTSPSFGTLQDAASAVKSRGVSGPVFINIRPGTYTRNGGATTLFVLDSSIVGVSPTNRITFQPDAAAGGDVDNVILQADFNSSSNPRVVAIVRTDYTTIRNLTFKDTDSMDTPVGYFIASLFDNDNTSIEGLEVDGCKFIGTTYFASGGQFGTDIGIGSYQNLASASFTRNRFYRICRGITNVNDSNRGGTIVVEDNEFYQGYQSATGSGNQLGTAIELACTHASIKRNIIDLAGGRGAKSGIEVIFATSAVIERNLIKNRVSVAANGFTGISVRNPFFAPDSILIANNAIVANQAWVGTFGMDIQTANTKVLYNTIVNAAGGGGNNIALVLTGANCTVLNNIILEMSSASYVAFDQGNAGSAQNLVSDYNILFIREDAGASGLIRHNGTMFTSLTGYQAGTGLDTNSVSKTILFSDEFHLDACQAQDPDLNGIPIPGITIDYDGATRNAVKPFKGADESVRIPFDMFADGFRAGLPGPPLSLAAGDFFDNDNDDDIAVPTYDNRQVLLFRNQRPGRSFVQSGILSTSVQPTVIKLFDLDHDSHLDLIVGGDTTALQVFWGDGLGNFPADTTIFTTDSPFPGNHGGRVRSLDTGRVDLSPGISSTVLITEDDSFLPNISFLGYLKNNNGRHLSHDLFVRRGPETDTIPAVLGDLVSGDLNGDGESEVAAITIGSPSSVYVFKDTVGGRVRYEYPFGTASYIGHNSSIVMRNFDGDTDDDLLTTSASENSCMFIRNQGNLNFSVDTIPAERSRGVVALDYENDGDFDFITTNRTLYDRGITVFLNDGLGHFTEKPNCFFPFASGFPNGIIASDFDLDGKTDIAIASSFDSLFVLYNLGGFNGTTGVDEHPTQQLPTEISLSQNYPNPFNPSTRIEYKLSVQSHVTVKIYNILGQEVASLVDEVQMVGNHVTQWNGGSSHGLPVSSGVYFYRLEARETTGQFLFAGVKKMILMK
jgi:hypothetical protein